MPQAAELLLIPGAFRQLGQDGRASSCEERPNGLEYKTGSPPPAFLPRVTVLPCTMKFDAASPGACRCCLEMGEK